MKIVEAQIDRLVGPTHHFGGLGMGNIASKTHAGHTSNPRAAALQGLDKMRLVASMGVPQWILPPQPRPAMRFLRSLGFGGRDSDVLSAAHRRAPDLLSAATSCSAMWTANAATVTPAMDSGGERTNVTIANLDASIHRAIEPQQTRSDLHALLADSCVLHEPLPGGAAMRDEGAANHMRLSARGDGPGLNIFVYGDGQPAPQHNWPRQTRAACEAIARLHRLPPENTFFWKQHAGAIDAGTFHNDVVAMSHHELLIHHEMAFDEEESEVRRLEDRFRQLTGSQLKRITVSKESLSIDDAVQTYLFNSQIVSPATGGRPVIVCTSQVQRHDGASTLVETWCQRDLFADVHYVNLDQSMSGGGGPACLRLRVPLAADALRAMPQASRWSESLDAAIRELIGDVYVTELTIEQLASEAFHLEASRARQQLVGLLAGGPKAA